MVNNNNLNIFTACCPQLETLQISNNFLQSYEDLEHLTELDNLSCLDISNNKIEDESILQVLENMKGLVCWDLFLFLCIKNI